MGRLGLEGRELREFVKSVRDDFHKAVRDYVENTLNRAQELEALEEAARLIPAIGQARALGLLGPMGPRDGEDGPEALRRRKRGPRGFGLGAWSLGPESGI